MSLIGLFQYGNKGIKSHNTSTGRAPAIPSSSQLPHAVRNLSAGQTIQGEVVGRNGNEVQIRVDKDVVITAKMDADMNVSVGQSLTFEVKGNSGVQIALRPLYENLTQDANVLKALEAAKLPATNELVRMVSSMMERGMPIDKNSLMEMGKLVMTNAGTAPETIVSMKSFQIPITPENIGQFENYQSYQHQILNTVTDILMEIPNAFHAMLNAGDGNGAIDFYTHILQLFSGVQIAEGENGNTPAGNVFADIAGEMTQETAAPFINAEGGKGAENLQKAFVQAEGEMAKEQANLVKNNGLETEDAAGIQKPQDHPLLLEDALDGNGRGQLAASLGRLGISQELLGQIQNGKIPVEQLLKEIQLMLAGKENGGNQADILKLFGSKEYNQLLNKQIEQQWMIRPEEVADKKNVEELYNRLRQQAARLTEALGQAVKDTPLAKSLTTMQNNIDFMNQVNQMFNYIQLPLKMSGGDAHGDLYVYTNRKSTMREDGSVSALLHLDMEYLGPLDVYVVLKEKNVNTQFYLQDESMIDFIAGHIHILNERLEKRGYSLHAEMKVNEEEQDAANVIKNITAQEQKNTMIARYAFDVRA